MRRLNLTNHENPSKWLRDISGFLGWLFQPVALLLASIATVVCLILTAHSLGWIALAGLVIFLYILGLRLGQAKNQTAKIALAYRNEGNEAYGKANALLDEIRQMTQQNDKLRSECLRFFTFCKSYRDLRDTVRNGEVDREAACTLLHHDISRFMGGLTAGTELHFAALDLVSSIEQLHDYGL